MIKQLSSVGVKTFESSHRFPYGAAKHVLALSDSELRQLWTDIRNDTSAFLNVSNLRQSETDGVKQFLLQQFVETGGESPAPCSPRKRRLTPQLTRQSTQSKVDHGSRSNDRRIQFSTNKKRYMSTRRVSFCDPKYKTDLLSPSSPKNHRLSIQSKIQFDLVAGPVLRVVDVDGKVRAHFEALTNQLKSANR